MTTANAGLNSTADQAIETTCSELDALGLRLMWDISAIGSSILRIAELLGKQIGISGSQWITLKAIEALGNGEGVAIKDVAALLNVDRSFLSAQSKILEKRGLIHRHNAKAADRRLVFLSLTEGAINSLKDVRPSHNALETNLRGEFDNDMLKALVSGLLTVRLRLERAVLLVAAGR